MTPIRLDPRQHTVVPTTLSRYLRRVFRDPSWITVWNSRYQITMICRWFNRYQNIAIEEWALPRGLKPWQATTKDVDILRFKHSPDAIMYQINFRRRAIAEAKDGGLAEAQEAADVHLDLREHYRRKASLTHQDNPFWVMF